MAVFIAWKQHHQLTTITEVAQSSRKIINKIDADNYERQMIDQFFCILNGTQRFICYLPVGWTGKPLPSIHAGDYHALHVLQTLLGSSRLDLTLQSVTEIGKVTDRDVDAIFLCSPQANPALEELAKPLEMKANEKPKDIPRFGNIQIPCWFANESGIGLHDGKERVTKTIWIQETHQSLWSPSEQAYVQAEPNVPFISDSPLQTDYAIVLRVTRRPGRKAFVIAGIHQYGTWIAGEYLNRLVVRSRAEDANSTETPEMKLVLGQDDFVAIVCGDFRTSTLSVENLGIHHQCLWRRIDDHWVRLGSESSQHALRKTHSSKPQEKRSQSAIVTG